MLPQASFWKNKRVFMTGHTGFKGAWLSLWLEQLGAQVTGYSHDDGHDYLLHRSLQPHPFLSSTIADIRNKSSLRSAIEICKPDIVIHLAAQALVRRSYRNPSETFEVNALGTLNLLDVLHETGLPRAVLIVTSDKVYRNTPGANPFCEDDPLGGTDPYSMSKVAAEMITATWRDQLFGKSDHIGISRAGNVIGGGDWAEDRLVPDVVRSWKANTPIKLRYPHSTRSWQYVLDILRGYLLYLEHLSDPASTPPKALNFGPPSHAPEYSTAAVVDILQSELGHPLGWISDDHVEFAEHSQLNLNSELSSATIGYRSHIDVPQMLNWVASWYRALNENQNMRSVSINQIAQYCDFVTRAKGQVDV